MLEIESLTTRYGSIAALRAVTLRVGEGEIVGVIGPNGAGKTTLLNSVAGLLNPAAGRVLLDGGDVTGAPPDRMLRAGVALVPEHRRLFADLTVRENLLVAGITATARQRAERLEETAELFPVLGDRRETPAGYLSGGEAQQLAIARALMSAPRILLMDEPSLGLAPTLVDLVFDLIGRLATGGQTLLVVEQNAHRMLDACDRAYIMRSGEIATEGPGRELLRRTDLFDTYLGPGTDPTGPTG
ncbi:MAG: ABC transporter ATP-binding protein [bacterium]|nr:ABC transporter ATP-binding protein [bacterium]